MGKIKLIEFLPPILFRGISYLKKKFSASNMIIKYSPFDQLPNDFYFINAIDLNYVEDKPIQLTQMDCIFRNKKYIPSP
tara:strand:+ start:303 stop:539 length:237 start_codon:yes stop_codon:yes gene_type:complete